MSGLHLRSEQGSGAHSPALGPAAVLHQTCRAQIGVGIDSPSHRGCANHGARCSTPAATRLQEARAAQAEAESRAAEAAKLGAARRLKEAEARAESLEELAGELRAELERQVGPRDRGSLNSAAARLRGGAPAVPGQGARGWRWAQGGEGMLAGLLLFGVPVLGCCTPLAPDERPPRPQPPTSSARQAWLPTQHNVHGFVCPCPPAARRRRRARGAAGRRGGGPAAALRRGRGAPAGGGGAHPRGHLSAHAAAGGHAGGLLPAGGRLAGGGARPAGAAAPGRGGGGGGGGAGGPPGARAGGGAGPAGGGHRAGGLRCGARRGRAPGHLCWGGRLRRRGYGGSPGASPCPYVPSGRYACSAGGPMAVPPGPTARSCQRCGPPWQTRSRRRSWSGSGGRRQRSRQATCGPTWPLPRTR